MFDTLDQAVVLFTPGQLRAMNVAQAMMMFVVALHLDLGSLRRVGEHPKAVFATLAAQWLMPPLLAVLLIAALRMPMAPALGLLLIACCPGGGAAAFLTLLARGNVAVAVAAATLSMLLSAVLTPMLFALGSTLAGLDERGDALPIDRSQLLTTVLLYLLLPLATGLVLRQWCPRAVGRVRGPLKVVLGVLLALVVLRSLQNNAASLRQLIVALTPLVAGFHAATLLLAWLLARALRLGVAERRAMTLSVGIGNAGLALLLVFGFFGGNGAMAALVAWWSVWRILACGLLTLAWLPRGRAPAASAA